MMAALVIVAEVALIAFLVIGVVTFVTVSVRRSRRRGPLPPWPRAVSYYGNADLPLPSWVNEYGEVIDPDEDRDDGAERPGQA